MKFGAEDTDAGATRSGRNFRATPRGPGATLTSSSDEAKERVDPPKSCQDPGALPSSTSSSHRAHSLR